MSTVLAIPSGMWILLPGTDWEVFQDSANVLFLGEIEKAVLIRRSPQAPRIWGPRPVIEHPPGRLF